ncbi:MAG: response regulator [Acetobacteraceae bacterium]|nr:response regulator [Acetobacteraceae bacterium]
MGPLQQRTADEQVVHVIDDDDAVRDSLAILFDSVGLQARTYGSALSFLDVARQLRAGCVLTDVRMPDIDGLSLQQRLADLDVRLPVIVMTAHADVPIAVRALKAGGFDFIEKPFDQERLVAAVRKALAHSAAQSRTQQELREIAARLEALTPREREVLDGLVAGQPNKAIALDLGTSPRTIEVHRARIMEKMGAQSLPELVGMVIRARFQDQ